MNEQYLRILAAVFLGLVIPGFVMKLSAPAAEQRPLASGTSLSQNDEVRQSGVLVLMPDTGIQWMPLDEYVTGVILAEMPTTYDADALCAQAVAARTYALKRQEGKRHSQGAVCTDPACCQAFITITDFLNGLGYESDVSAAKTAAEATSGLVITYEEELIEATYFHSSGGRTEEAMAVWGVDLPYLTVVESPGEENLEDYMQRTFYSKKELEKLLDRQLPGTPASWIGWTTYTVGGGIDKLLLAGVQYKGIELRSLLKLNSTVLSIQPDSDGLWITAWGKGHRVGMSQTGAQAMAMRGCTWREIIDHYYPGTRIDKMEDVG